MSECDVVLSQLNERDREYILRQLTVSTVDDMSYQYYDHSVVILWDCPDRSARQVLDIMGTTRPSPLKNVGSRLPFRSVTMQIPPPLTAVPSSTSASRGIPYNNNSYHPNPHSPSNSTRHRASNRRACRSHHFKISNVPSDPTPKTNSAVWACRSASSIFKARVCMDAVVPVDIQFEDFVEYYFLTRFGLPRLAREHQSNLLSHATLYRTASGVLSLFMDLFHGKCRHDSDLCVLLCTLVSRGESDAKIETRTVRDGAELVSVVSAMVVRKSAIKLVKELIPGIPSSALQMIFSPASELIDLYDLVRTVGDCYDKDINPYLQHNNPTSSMYLPRAPVCLTRRPIEVEPSPIMNTYTLEDDEAEDEDKFNEVQHHDFMDRQFAVPPVQLNSNHEEETYEEESIEQGGKDDAITQTPEDNTLPIWRRPQGSQPSQGLLSPNEEALLDSLREALQRKNSHDEFE